jgi:hypothetical protein
MIRIAPLLLSLAVAFSETVPAADSSLVAEGDFVAQKSDGIKPLAHWKLWRLKRGEYEVVESSAATNAPITQIFRFDAQLLPIGYVLDMGQNSRNPGFTPMSVACKYETQELRCDTEYKGTKSTASVPAKQPYVFLPGEFYGLDFAWFLTEVVQLADRSKAKESMVNVYVMTDSETKRDEIALKLDSPVNIVFTREESVQVMGKTQTVRRYEVRGLGELSVLKVTSRGLVVSAGTESNPGIGFGMANYKEYEPWGPNR